MLFIDNMSRQAGGSREGGEKGLESYIHSSMRKSPKPIFTGFCLGGAIEISSARAIHKKRLALIS